MYICAYAGFFVFFYLRQVVKLECEPLRVIKIVNVRIEHRFVVERLNNIKQAIDGFGMCSVVFLEPCVAAWGLYVDAFVCVCVCVCACVCARTCVCVCLAPSLCV